MALNHDRFATDGTFVDDNATPPPSVIKPSSSTTEKTDSKSLNPDAKSYVYIPPVEEQGRRYSQGRSLVLCFDGTGDQFDDDNSNVVGFCSMLKKDDPSRQLVYYQTGIGTYLPGFATPIVAAISKAVDSCIAWSLDDHIMNGYEFLMENYRAGDRICIFGFSRGAYTARCLAGMLHKVGLLPASNRQQIPFAYKMYKRADDLGWKQSNAFKQAFCIDVDIDFLGVWDTVSSVGVIPKKRLPFTTSNTVVRVFRHAVSLDERRARFQPNTWNEPDPKEATLSVTDQEIELLKEKKREAAKRGKRPHDDAIMRMLEKKYSKTRTQDTDVDEVWFAGAHCDVGGGSVINGSKPCLAHIPFRWMIRQCFATETGILFSTIWLARLGLNPSSVWPAVTDRNKIPPAPFTPSECQVMSIPKKSSAPVDAYAVDPNDYDMGYLLQESEEERDLKDALAPLYDQLSLNWHWWILELIPTRHRHQNPDKTWSENFYFHLGRGRVIHHHQKVKVHRTVQVRMAAEAPIDNSWMTWILSFFGRKREGKQYKPKANLQLENVLWVA